MDTLQTYDEQMSKDQEMQEREDDNQRHREE